MLMRACGLKVGAHLTASTLLAMWVASKSSSSWAESSFLPAWRAIITDMLLPRRWKTLRAMARPASTW